jgi:hypothetical protein
MGDDPFFHQKINQPMKEVFPESIALEPLQRVFRRDNRKSVIHLPRSHAITGTGWHRASAPCAAKKVRQVNASKTGQMVQN